MTMPPKFTHTPAVFALAAAMLLAPMAAPAAGDMPPPPPQSDTQEARGQRIQWWREARFGMFIHWGLYAIPGGVWKDKVHDSGYSEWIMFDEKIPAKEYEKLAGKFNPVKFDAKAWTTIAKKAGMKYLVLTTKHHDGFSMFQSGLTPYNVVDATPFKRDVTRELVDACRDAGLRFGCYYSIDRDWYRPQGPGNHYRQANVWDYPDSKREDFDRYFTTFAKPQVEELLTKYQPDLLWFDEIDMKTDAQVEDLYQSIRRLRPACLINSRIQGCRFPAKSRPRIAIISPRATTRSPTRTSASSGKTPAPRTPAMAIAPMTTTGCPPPISFPASSKSSARAATTCSMSAPRRMDSFPNRASIA